MKSKFLLASLSITAVIAATACAVFGFRAADHGGSGWNISNGRESSMMRKLLIITVIGILLTGIAAGQSKKVNCNRQCLEGFVNKYLDAMASHNISKAPCAKKAKFTENAKEIPIAKTMEGLWSTPTSLVDYKFYIADPQAGQVAFVSLVKEGEKPALLSMRLKIEKKKITEIESVVVRNMNLLYGTNRIS